MTNGGPGLDVGRLRLLREVSLRGTIAGAARVLGLTPSAVSQQLAVLEREAGTALVDRSPRGVVLTGAGHLLAARAVQVMDILAAARADLDRVAGAVAGPVGLACVASAAASFVSSAVCALRESHPGIAPTVVAVEPRDALELLAAGDVDLAVVDEYDYVPLALPEFVVATYLCSEPLVVVRPVGTGPLRPPRLADLADLAEQPWVMPPDYAACGQAVRAACRDCGFEPDVRWESDDMLLLARAVADGHGVAVLPQMSVPAEAAGIYVSPLGGTGLTRRLTAAARSSAMDRPVIAALLAELVRAATDEVSDSRRGRPSGAGSGDR